MYIQRSEWYLQRTRLSRSLWKRYLHLSVIKETYIRISYGQEEQLGGSYFETGYFIDIKWYTFSQLVIWMNLMYQGTTHQAVILLYTSYCRQMY